jgi:hypothetical protein
LYNNGFNVKNYQVAHRGIIFPKSYQKMPHLKTNPRGIWTRLRPFRNHTIFTPTLCHLGLIKKNKITTMRNVEFCNHTHHKKFTENLRTLRIYTFLKEYKVMPSSEESQNFWIPSLVIVVCLNVLTKYQCHYSVRLN